MKKNPYASNAALVAVLTLFLAVCTLIRTFVPMAVLPELDIPNMVLLSLIALLAGHYLAPAHRTVDLFSLILAAVTFGLLPFAAGAVSLNEVGRTALVGGTVFWAVFWLFREMTERLSTGPEAKAAPVFSALGLYLAAQCFAGMIL